LNTIPAIPLSPDVVAYAAAYMRRLRRLRSAALGFDNAMWVTIRIAGADLAVVRRRLNRTGSGLVAKAPAHLRSMGWVLRRDAGGVIGIAVIDAQRVGLLDLRAMFGRGRSQVELTITRDPLMAAMSGGYDETSPDNMRLAFISRVPAAVDRRNPGTISRELLDNAQRLRSQGLSLREIAERLDRRPDGRTRSARGVAYLLQRARWAPPPAPVANVAPKEWRDPLPICL
jgi:hypothetical protein